MTRSRRRNPRTSSVPSEPLPRVTPPATRGSRVPIPNWEWRTFPVFFALVAGLVVGAQVGVVAQMAGNTSALILLSVCWLVFGFALSRWFVRRILVRRLARPPQS